MSEPHEPRGPNIDENGVDLDLVDLLLSMTPAERIARHEAALELVRALQKAGTEYYGFDPRTPGAPDDPTR